jgi:8-oxo-dGTP diphosphatase
MNLKYEIVFRLKKIYWLLVRPKRQGVKCVLEHHGKILMVKRRFGTSMYVFPGGAIRKGEAPEMAVRREIKEDLGVVLDSVQAKGVFSQEVLHRQETLHVFSAAVSSSSMTFDHEKIQDTAWFKPDSLPELTPVSRAVLTKYQAS